MIISDIGTEVVNTDNLFSLCIGVTQEGMDVLLAFGPGVNVPLAGVGDRPHRALAAIVKKHKERALILDLNDLLGPRPNLAIAKAIVGKNGEKLVG